MILDGYWKIELLANSLKLKFWSFFLRSSEGFVAHQINKNVLHSAVIARKIYEDDIHYKKEADRYNKQRVEDQLSEIHLPEMPLLTYRIDVTEFPFVGDKDFIIERIIPDNYSTGSNNNYLAKDICNYVIHAFVWGVARYINSREVVFCVASDKNKEEKLILVRISDWIKYLKACIEYSVI